MEIKEVETVSGDCTLEVLLWVGVRGREMEPYLERYRDSEGL